MEQAIKLYGSLVVAFIGFIIPMIGILLSIFSEGISILTIQYENEKAKSEKNIKEQLKKEGETEKTDVSAIQRSINELKSIKKKAENKLSYLNPNEQLLRLVVPFLLTFLAITLSFLVKSVQGKLAALLISIIIFGIGIFVLRKMVEILAEAKRMIDSNKKKFETEMKEILSRLSEKIEGVTPSFLKDVYICMNGNDIDDDEGQLKEMQANRKEEIKISVRNTERKMAKNIEIGFILPLDFIVEKKSYYSLFIDEGNQVVRYEMSSIHGHTNLHLSPLVVTPLKKGDYKIKTFVKAENIEAVYRDVNLKVN